MVLQDVLASGLGATPNDIIGVGEHHANPNQTKVQMFYVFQYEKLLVEEWAVFYDSEPDILLIKWEASLLATTVVTGRTAENGRLETTKDGKGEA
jgi:hypothetical protein